MQTDLVLHVSAVLYASVIFMAKDNLPAQSFLLFDVF